MPRRSPFAIVLSEQERAKLEAQARQYTLPYRDVVRAKAMLLAAQGLGNHKIAQRLDLPRPKVSKWRKRFHDERLAGLEDRARAGRPRVFLPELV